MTWARAALGVWVACGACDTPASAPTPPWPVGAFPAASGPVVDLEDVPTAGTPVAERTAWAQAELGRLLFYDPILSSDHATACATCHSELWGMSDGLARSIGVGGGLLTGPGRIGPSVLSRNAPALWNVGFRRALFWDGRSDALGAQVLSPLAAPLELNREPALAVADLAGIPEYATLFAAAFPESATGEAVSIPHLETAIAAFERTLVSDSGLYDGWLDGDRGALDGTMLRGMQVFADAKCQSCHVPPTFDAELFAVRHAGAGPDRGRAAVTGLAADEGAFKVPSLRNLRDTGPYFHDGSVAELDAAIDHECAESGVALSASDRTSLVVFLTQALVDRSREPTRPVFVPSGLPVPEDGFRILR